MIRLNLFVVLLIFIIINSCYSQKGGFKLCDPYATAETNALYNNLHLLANKGYIIGHQDDLAYGVNWRYKDGRSDVHDVVKDYPGMYGWDLGGTEHGSKVDIDGVPFDKMRQFIRDGYDRGGVITFSWHMDNPVTDKHAWDSSLLSLQKMLPGGPYHNKYKSYLDKAAIFLSSLKGPNGENIPVIYRPFHELTGNWFWWCKHANSKEDFIKIWKFTVDYLRIEKGLHNLIYCYNVADFDDENGLMDYYPGDDYVDIISFDFYQTDVMTNEEFIATCLQRFRIMNEVGQKHRKLSAFAEVGYEAIPDPDWWTTVLDKVMAGSNLSYVLMWRNHGLQKHNNRMHYYVPYPGQVSAGDFQKLYDLPHTYFESDLKRFQLYSSKK